MCLKPRDKPAYSLTPIYYVSREKSRLLVKVEYRLWGVGQFKGYFIFLYKLSQIKSIAPNKNVNYRLWGLGEFKGYFIFLYKLSRIKSIAQQKFR
ncbi:hypothetical protein BJP34_33200 [Moorena producens PAL-8-15-08-1]|uniref:Uncharacterized protein n=1 Tax=Moorena producens PAL-8-15-08-1 TaxID=1458985 RepID=A0A1D8U174_9CYAN|nr:hypothetical protein BJP34_33200 [Moorena producens PAL-8-15-08-1]